MKSKRLIISLSEKDYRELKELAAKERLSISALVRHFIIRKLYSNLLPAGKDE